MKQRKSWPLRVVSQLLPLCLLVTIALAGAQPGGTAQPGTVDQLPDPLTMSRISLGLEIAFMDYYRGESLPDFFGGFYDNSNQGGEAQTIYNVITDVEFSDDFSFDALCLY